MTVALPIWEGHVSPVLDTATRLLLVSGSDLGQGERREILLGPLSIEALARSIAELRVDVLLCAAISEPLCRDLERKGVRVKPHVCGEAEKVLRAFYSGKLQQPEFRMPGCWGYHTHGLCCRRTRATPGRHTLL